MSGECERVHLEVLPYVLDRFTRGGIVTRVPGEDHDVEHRLTAILGQRMDDLGDEFGFTLNSLRFLVAEIQRGAEVIWPDA